ncbi:hypothetical protein X798_02664, partial [Onchocerca flexuosa]
MLSLMTAVVSRGAKQISGPPRGIRKKAMSSSSLSSSRHRAQSDPTKLPLLTFRNPSVSCVWNICLLRLRCDKSRIKFGFLRSIHVRIDVDFNDRSVRRSH